MKNETVRDPAYRLVEKLREQYVETPASKMKLLKRLYLQVRVLGILTAIAMVVSGVCAVNAGVQLILTWRLASGNILITLIGVILVILSWPVYRIITKERRERFAAEIITLCNEISEKDSKTM